MGANFVGLCENVNNISKDGILARDRIKNLLKIGTKPGVAIPIYQTRKGPWKCARTLAIQTGMTNQWLKD